MSVLLLLGSSFTISYATSQKNKHTPASTRSAISVSLGGYGLFYSIFFVLMQAIIHSTMFKRAREWDPSTRRHRCSRPQWRFGWGLILCSAAIGTSAIVLGVNSRYHREFLRVECDEGVDMPKYGKDSYEEDRKRRLTSGDCPSSVENAHICIAENASEIKHGVCNGRGGVATREASDVDGCVYACNRGYCWFEGEMCEERRGEEERSHEPAPCDPEPKCVDPTSVVYVEPVYLTVLVLFGILCFLVGGIALQSETNYWIRFVHPGFNPRTGAPEPKKPAMMGEEATESDVVSDGVKADNSVVEIVSFN
jgi:hypothetical protein